MADNVTLDPGTGGAVVRTDDAAGVHWPYTKIAFGADNTQTIVGSISSNPFPVALSATDNAVLDTIDSVLDTLNAKFVTGTVIGDVNLGATDNAVLDSIATNTGALLTDTELRATPVAVQISDTSFAVADGSALGEGVLIQGDDGVDRKNINVDATTGDVQVDVTNTVTVDGSGVTQPISGTVTANLSATDNAVLDSIAAAQLPDGHNVTVDNASIAITAASLPLPTGAATAAAQLPDGHNVTVDNTTGSPVNVQIGDGTSQATVRNLAANDALNVAMVDAAGDQITSFGGGTQYTVDDAGPTVVTMAGVVRDDALTTLTEVDGDATLLRVNSTGALHVTGAGGGTQYSVDDAGPTVVTMAGVVRDDSLTTLTEVDGDATLLRVNSTGALHVTGGGGGTEYTEDVATPAPIVGTATMMERDDALATLTPIEGDWASLRCNARGALWVEHDTTTAIPITDNAGSLTVDGTVTANLSATDNAVLDTIDAVLDTINAKLVTGTVIGDVNLGATDNAVLDSIVTNTTGLAGTVSGSELQVDVITLPNVTLAAGTNTNEIVGDAAHDAPVAGNPVLVGLESRTTAPTAVGNGDVVRAQATSLGKQVIQPYAIPASTWSYASSAAVTDISNDVAKAAAGAGIRNYITGVQVMNGHDTVGTAVVIKDGATVIWQGWAEQTGGGCSAHFDPPLRGTANTAVNVANVTTGSSTFFNLQGYVSAE